MSAGWVAGSVRAKALARRRLGPAAARRLAGASSLAEALRALSDTPYHRASQPPGSLAAAQHAIASTIIWDLRVLAGWLPRPGVQLLRTLAGWFELANTDELLESMADRPAGPEFRLGALATAWPRLREAPSPAGLRAALTASPWRDPGGDSVPAIRLGMRARWTVRAAGCGEPVRTWAAGAAAALLASERFTGGGQPNAVGIRGLASLVGPAAYTAATLEDLARTLPEPARWVLAGISSPSDLWRAEPAWWARVEDDGFQLLHTADADRGPVVGAIAVMSADARRISAALEIASRGGGRLEAYDAVV